MDVIFHHYSLSDTVSMIPCTIFPDHDMESVDADAPCECSVSRARAHTSHTGCVCALRSLGHGCVQEVKNNINTVRFLTQTARFVS